MARIGEPGSSTHPSRSPRVALGRSLSSLALVFQYQGDGFCQIVSEILEVRLLSASLAGKDTQACFALSWAWPFRTEPCSCAYIAVTSAILYSGLSVCFLPGGEGGANDEGWGGQLEGSWDTPVPLSSHSVISQASLSTCYNTRSALGMCTGMATRKKKKKVL